MSERPSFSHPLADVVNAYHQLVPDKNRGGGSDVNMNIDSSSGPQSVVNVLNTITQMVMTTETNTTVDTTMGVPTNETVGSPTSAMVGTLVDAPMDEIMGAQMDTLQNELQNAEIIEEGVFTFLQVVSPLLAALDEVAKIHPFIGGANPFYHTALIVKYLT